MIGFALDSKVPMKTPRPSDTLAALLRGAGPTPALTGAGVSSESGLQTFRGPGWLWDGAHERFAVPSGEVLPRLLAAAGLGEAQAI